MENLKELEEFVNQNKDEGYFGLSSEMIQLIGKLIARNKELEQKNRVKIIGKYGDVTLDELLKDKYIPKSKVIEIIENYYNEYSDTKEEITKFIEELLQEGDK